jgi:hypothetical protein
MGEATRGTPDQLGIVAKEVDTAIESWLRAGAGPFYRGLGIPFDGWTYRGRAIAFELDVAVGNLGELQIEILCPIGAGESPYHDFVAAGREGLQHLCWRVESIEDEAERANAPLLLEGSFAGIRLAYLDNEHDPLVELVERVPAVDAMFEAFRAPSIGWDGRDPIRPIEELWEGIA